MSWIVSKTRFTLAVMDIMNLNYYVIDFNIQGLLLHSKNVEISYIISPSNKQDEITIRQLQIRLTTILSRLLCMPGH